MIYFAYIVISLLATFIGSISGMGGGGIMKPIFDAMNIHDASEIKVMTMLATFAMAILSICISIPTFKRKKINIKTLIFLSLGAVGGGLLGEYLFSKICNDANDAIVKIVQNSLFAFVLIFVIIYLIKKDKIKSLNINNFILALPIGIILGLFSSFMGIGGGQINVPIIAFIFGFEIKIAVLCSLNIIVFTQLTNIIYLLAKNHGTGFVIEPYPYILLCVVIFALIGAIVGRFVAKKLNNKNTKYFCMSADALIFCLCIYNIIKYALTFK